MTLNDVQIREVQEALSDLVGSTLTSVVGRPACESFEFAKRDPVAVEDGRQTHGSVTMALSCYCDWRFEAPDGASFGPKHLRGDGFPSTPSREALDQSISSTLHVAMIAIRRDGALRIGLSEDYALEVLPRGEYDFEREVLRGDRRWIFHPSEDEPRGDLLFGMSEMVWKPYPQSMTYPTLMNIGP